MRWARDVLERAGGALTNSLPDVPEKSNQELFDRRADIQLRQAEALSASCRCRIWALARTALGTCPRPQPPGRRRGGEILMTAEYGKDQDLFEDLFDPQPPVDIVAAINWTYDASRETLDGVVTSVAT